MRKCVWFKVVLLFVMLVAMVSCAEEQFYGYPPHVPSYKGLTLLAKDSNDFTTAVQGNRISSMIQQTHSNTVVLSFFLYQENENSTTIEANTSGINPLTNEEISRTSTDNDLRIAIANAKSLGMNIVLNPLLRLYNGGSTRNIPYSQTWFNSYKKILIDYAAFAEVNGVSIFCIGNELSSSVNDETAQVWKSLIAEVRTIFSKKVVYTASWQGLEGYKNGEPELLWCPLFSSTDYIAFNAFPVLTSNGQTHGTFWGSETNRLNSIRSFLEEQYRTNRKKFLIMQTGLQSQLGAELEPQIERDVTISKRFPHEGIQELYYTYIIESLGKSTLCDGIFFWYWDAIPQVESIQKGSFSPENKLAVSVLNQWFSS